MLSGWRQVIKGLVMRWGWIKAMTRNLTFILNDAKTLEDFKWKKFHHMTYTSKGLCGLFVTTVPVCCNHEACSQKNQFSHSGNRVGSHLPILCNIRHGHVICFDKWIARRGNVYYFQVDVLRALSQFTMPFYSALEVICWDWSLLSALIPECLRYAKHLPCTPSSFVVLSHWDFSFLVTTALSRLLDWHIMFMKFPAIWVLTFQARSHKSFFQLFFAVGTQVLLRYCQSNASSYLDLKKNHLEKDMLFNNH